MVLIAPNGDVVVPEDGDAELQPGQMVFGQMRVKLDRGDDDKTTIRKMFVEIDGLVDDLARLLPTPAQS
jgi:hypothetical protein